MTRAGVVMAPEAEALPAEEKQGIVTFVTSRPFLERANGTEGLGMTAERADRRRPVGIGPGPPRRESFENHGSTYREKRTVIEPEEIPGMARCRRRRRRCRKS